MSKVSGMRAVLAIRTELNRQGIGRTSNLGGGHNAGWIERDHLGSTGFSIRPTEDGKLDWHLVMSGRPHMRYRNYKEWQGDESYELHEPQNPESVFPKIRAAFASLGIAVEEVRCSGWQTMWDDDVDFNVRTTKPDWLADWDPSNAEDRSFMPRLLSGSVAMDERLFPLKITSSLPIYDLGNGTYATTLEGVHRIMKEAAGLVDDRWVTYGKTAMSAEGVFVIERAGRRMETAPKTVVNFWGDELSVYPLPRGTVTPNELYGSDVPTMVDREYVVPDFATLDAQLGDGAPWSMERASTGMKP